MFYRCAWPWLFVCTHLCMWSSGLFVLVDCSSACLYILIQLHEFPMQFVCVKRAELTEDMLNLSDVDCMSKICTLILKGEDRAIQVVFHSNSCNRREANRAIYSIRLILYSEKKGSDLCWNNRFQLAGQPVKPHVLFRHGRLCIAA